MQLKHLENKLEWHLVHIRFRVQLIPIWHKLKPAQLDHIGNSEDFLVFSVEAEGRLPHEVSHRWFESFMNNVEKHTSLNDQMISRNTQNQTRRSGHTDQDTYTHQHTQIGTHKNREILTNMLAIITRYLLYICSMSNSQVCNIFMLYMHPLAFVQI